MSLQGLAENIYLLERITKQPENPHENEVPACLRRDKAVGRQLSLNHEQSVVSALSFLLSYTDDPNRVSAFCIEENPEKRTLFVNVAVNTGETTKLKAGLEGIASILMDEASDDRSHNNREKLFDHVLSFNRSRLLSRLRSKHSSFMARTKKPIINSLAEANEKLRSLGSVSSEMLEELGRFSKNLMTLFIQLEGLSRKKIGTEQTEPLLAAIVTASNDLITSLPLDEILDQIPRNDDSFPDSRKTSMVDGFRKLGRYITLGPHLLRFARRFSIFRKIEIRSIEIRPASIGGTQSKDVTVSPTGLLYRYLKHGGQPAQESDETIGGFERRLGANLEAVQEDLRKRSLSKARIHAEIQLLFYYELKSQIKLKPRVICASKNACYLCNTFLEVHGQFYTPRSHGKLYPQWTLPGLSTLSLPAKRFEELQAVYARFHTEIELKIFACLRRSVLAQSYDNESRILNVRSLTPSVVSRVNNNENEREILQDDHARRESSPCGDVPTEPLGSPCADEGGFHDNYMQGSAPSPRPSVASLPAVDGLTSRSSWDGATTSQERLQDITGPTAETAGTATSMTSPSDFAMTRPHHLIPGREVYYFISLSSPPVRLYASRIHIELSYDDALSVASTTSLRRRDSKIHNAGEGVQICAVWLQADEVEPKQCEAHEIDLAADWTLKKLDGVLFEPDGLMLRNGEDVVRLTARNERP